MNIVIIGQGGHSKVIEDIIYTTNSHKIVGYLDDKYDEVTFNHAVYTGPISFAYHLIDIFQEVQFVIGIGNNAIRKKIVQKLDLAEQMFIPLIHSSAVVSPRAKIGYGTVVMANAVINADSHIGHHNIINTNAVVEHDNQVSDFVHISPNATLTGAVQIEEGVHVGAGATIIPNTKVGEWSVIGAGASVINDIPANCTAVGIPAKVKLKERVEFVKGHK